MVSGVFCPRCESEDVSHNGHIHTGKQNHICKKCGRNFVLDPKNKPIPDKVKEYITKALLERNSIHGIARIFDVSMSWLMEFVNTFLDSVPLDLNAWLPPIHSKEPDVLNGFDLVCEADELWSFVGEKNNKQWIWLVMERSTRMIIAYHIGGRTAKDAKILWDSLPEPFKNRGYFFTDFLKSYQCAFSVEQHEAVGKESGLTNHVERVNNTFRQRISRLVRCGLGFSKKLSNHINAIRYFIRNYNKTIIENMH